MTYTRLVTDPIDPGEILNHVGSDEDGAVLLFLGTVRDHADGRPVSGMTYESYAEMAGPVLDEIAAEAAANARTDRIVVVHRVGELAVGEISVAIAISSPHRAEVYDGSRYVIEEIKKRLPVWKKEHYAEGPSEWVVGTTPASRSTATAAAEDSA